MWEVQQKAFEVCLQSFVEANTACGRPGAAACERSRGSAHASAVCAERHGRDETTSCSQGGRLTNSTKDVERVTCAQRQVEDGIDYVDIRHAGTTCGWTEWRKLRPNVGSTPRQSSGQHSSQHGNCRKTRRTRLALNGIIELFDSYKDVTPS